MVSFKRKRSSSRAYRKRKSARGRGGLNKKIAKIAKTVALRQQETKHAILSYATRELYHNAAYNITDNLLHTTQGVNDRNHRVGDEITLRGIKIYLQIESKWDRPNTTVRVVVGKARQAIAAGTDPYKPISGIKVIDPVDMEQVMKVYANRRYRFGDKDTMIGTDEGIGVLNRPTTHFRTIWIPLMNVKYKYTNQSSTQGTAYNIPMWVTAYDHSSSLTLDNIGSIRISTELFFKDG